MARRKWHGGAIWPAVPGICTFQRTRPGQGRRGLPDAGALVAKSVGHGHCDGYGLRASGQNFKGHFKYGRYTCVPVLMSSLPTDQLATQNIC